MNHSALTQATAQRRRTAQLGRLPRQPTAIAPAGGRAESRCRTKPSRAISRCNSADTFGGSGTPSGTEPSPFRCTQSVNQASVLFRVKKVVLGTKPTPTPDTEIRTSAGRINILPQTTARAGWTTAFPKFPRVSDQWVMTRASDEINLVFSHLATTSTRLNKALSASACNSETSGNSDCT